MEAGHGFSDKDKDSDSDKQGGGLGCHRLRGEVPAKDTAVEEFFIGERTHEGAECSVMQKLEEITNMIKFLEEKVDMATAGLVLLANRQNSCENAAHN